VGGRLPPPCVQLQQLRPLGKAIVIRFTRYSPISSAIAARRPPRFHRYRLPVGLRGGVREAALERFGLKRFEPPWSKVYQCQQYLSDMDCDGLGQFVEHQRPTENRSVGGSIPPLGTILNFRLLFYRAFSLPDPGTDQASTPGADFGFGTPTGALARPRPKCAGREWKALSPDWSTMALMTRIHLGLDVIQP
jgi:hypothetical protein